MKENHQIYPVFSVFQCESIRLPPFRAGVVVIVLGGNRAVCVLQRAGALASILVSFVSRELKLEVKVNFSVAAVYAFFCPLCFRHR